MSKDINMMGVEIQSISACEIADDGRLVLFAKSNGQDGIIVLDPATAHEVVRLLLQLLPSPAKKIDIPSNLRPDEFVEKVSVQSQDDLLNQKNQSLQTHDFQIRLGIGEDRNVTFHMSHQDALDWHQKLGDQIQEYKKSGN